MKGYIEVAVRTVVGRDDGMGRAGEFIASAFCHNQRKPAIIHSIEFDAKDRSVKVVYNTTEYDNARLESSLEKTLARVELEIPNAAAPTPMRGW